MPFKKSHYSTLRFLADVNNFFGQCEIQFSDQNTNAIVAPTKTRLRENLIGRYRKIMSLI